MTSQEVKEAIDAAECCNGEDFDEFPAEYRRESATMRDFLLKHREALEAIGVAAVNK